ncbi:hypothetical protein AA313_de0207563 [Arthrobotrys entomopaga]|nr:hypothetical protein AA313_de0207563 [Arthrobotrys entomopaga]
MGWNETSDSGEVWGMTFPADCSALRDNATLSDYKLWKGGAGMRRWEEVGLEMRRENVSLWYPTGRYLGRGFSVLTGEDINSDDGGVSTLGNRGERLYSFGGLCLGGNSRGYTGNGRNDSFAADVWRFENTTALTTAINTTTSAIKNGTAGDVVDVSIALSKNAPIPEAGFSMTPVTILNSSSAAPDSLANDTVDVSGSLEGMLVLGGYTSENRFVGLGQLAVYSQQTESWSFVSAELNHPNITARAGHSAVLDERGEKIILFGGWVGNVTHAASPAMLSLSVGGMSNGGWEWDVFNTTEEYPGVGPGNMSLWGHAATLLEGNVMLITSGFEIGRLNDGGEQRVSEKTFMLNLTTSTWMKSYKYPMGYLSNTAIEEGKGKTKRDVGILAGVFGGVLLLVLVLAGLFCYARRQEEYADLPNEAMSSGGGGGGDKFHSLDLEYGKDSVVQNGLTPFSIARRNTQDATRSPYGISSPDSPELPPRPPAPFRKNPHRSQPSHVDMERVVRMQEEQEQRENMFQQSALERRRSLRSEMEEWVMEWADADAAAYSAEIRKRMRQEGRTNSRVRKESTTSGNGERYLKPGGKKMSTVAESSEDAGGRCTTSSSQYSDCQVSTLNTSEFVYDTPAEEVPYPIPPILISTAQAYGDQSPRNPRVLVGPTGVTAPLPRKMAQEFPIPTLIPRDSIAPTSLDPYSSSFGSNHPLLQQQQDGNEDEDEWVDITGLTRQNSVATNYLQDGSATDDMRKGSSFFTIPLKTFEQTRSFKRNKSIEDRVREEMYHPGPARSEEECRLSSIMDYYADSMCPTPIPEGTEEEEDEQSEHASLVNGGGIQTSTYEGERVVLGEKARMVVVTNHTVEEPITINPIRTQRYGPKQQQNNRESVVAPLLSETSAAQEQQQQQQEERSGRSNTRSQVSTRSRIPSIGSSIKRRAVAMAATLSPNSHSQSSSEKRSTSLGKRSVLHRRPQTAKMPALHIPNAPETTPQPHKAEILNMSDGLTDVLFAKGFEDDADSATGINDKVVQLVYTAPKGKLRVVNPSPRRVSSGGTDGSLGLFQQMYGQRRVSSSGSYPMVANGEGILRLGSAAQMRFGEMD